MSFEFECTNVVPGCEGKVGGESVEEVLGKAAEHAKEAHGLAPLDEATVDKVKASIVAVS
jgi:predicted small metal-binding protein